SKRRRAAEQHSQQRHCRLWGVLPADALAKPVAPGGVKLSEHPGSLEDPGCFARGWSRSLATSVVSAFGGALGDGRFGGSLLLGSGVLPGRRFRGGFLLWGAGGLRLG